LEKSAMDPTAWIGDTMRNGECPKCGAAAVFCGPADWSCSAGFTADTLSLGFMAHVPLITYVCTHCGFIEQYVRFTSDLERVAQKFERVD
jgi:hypothetical protein